MNIYNWSAVIWDWNGTVIDDVELCYNIFCEELERYSLPMISLKEYRDKFSFPVSGFYKKMGFPDGDEIYRGIAERFGKNYRERRTLANLNIGVEALLETFTSAKIPQFILSAYQDVELKKMVKERSLEDKFERVYGVLDNRAGSKKELGEDLIKESGVDATTTLFIGDTTHDYDVAKSLGVTPLIISRGHNSRRQLEDYGVDWIEDSLEGLFA